MSIIDELKKTIDGFFETSEANVSMATSDYDVPSREDAEYTQFSSRMDGAKCANCAHFRKGRRYCSELKVVVNPLGYCKYYRTCQCPAGIAMSRKRIGNGTRSFRKV